MNEEHGADQEPDPEGAALRLADDRGGEAEEEGDHQVLEAHPHIVAGPTRPNVQAGAGPIKEALPKTE